MRKSSTVLAAVAAAALTATTMAVAAGGTAARADTGPAADGAVATLPGSAAPYAAAGQAMGTVPAGNRLTIQFWLKSRTAAAASYASAVSTPGSRLFEHYLTPAA